MVDEMVNEVLYLRSNSRGTSVDITSLILEVISSFFTAVREKKTYVDLIITATNLKYT